MEIVEMGSRTWIKIYCDKWLDGTLRDETAELRGVWADVLVMAGDSHYGDDGTVCARPGIGYTDDMVMRILKIGPEQWSRAKKRLVETGRIDVDKNNVISVMNWSKYQSEYSRTKSTPSRCTKSTTESTAIEGRIEKEKKKRLLRFLVFWKSYPKKRSKNQALKTWDKINPNDILLGKMLRAIEEQKASREWRDYDGKYIPHPSTWLNAMGWEDEVNASIGKPGDERQRRALEF